MRSLPRDARSLALAVAFLVVGPGGMALAATNPSSAEISDERRAFAAALDRASGGEWVETLHAARAILKGDASSWRGWFLRFESIPWAPLDETDRSLLEALPEGIRSGYVGLLDVMTADRDARVEASEDLARRFPDLSIASAIAAGALLRAHRTGEGLAFASRALDADPTNEVAAREKAAALKAIGDRAAESAWACEVLRAFPYDRGLVEPALRACAEPATNEDRLAIYGGVAREWSGTDLAASALGKLLRRDSSDAVLTSIVRLFLPRDPSWWGEARNWTYLAAQRPAVMADPEVLGFLRELWAAMSHDEGGTASNTRPWVAFALGRSLLAAKEWKQARSSLERAVSETAVLGSILARRELAEALARDGDPEAARRLREEADVLEVVQKRPLDAREREIARSVLPRVMFHEIRTLDGAVSNVAESGAGAEIWFIWSANCLVARQQGSKLAGWIRSREVPASLTFRWVQHDVPGLEATARERATEWGLPASEVLLLPRGDATLRRLGVIGTPWTLLVVDGFVLAERPGVFDSEWLQLAARLAEAWREPAQSAREEPK